MTTHGAPSARKRGRRFAGHRFAGMAMAGAAVALGLVSAPASAEGPLLVPKTGIEKEFLTTTDVGKIIGQVVQEAQARHKPATIAIVDRLGAVLAVYRMTGAPANLPIESNPRGTNASPVLVNGLSGLSVLPVLNAPLVPTELEAITKAITGAYLSTSHGNAFSTRTASQI
ncbi:MAG TPA: heme-binding protein, partial [Magnetospirillaceae bacterium]|nr:heme-binding protein [Magnetospirillaceae bacterium]